MIANQVTDNFDHQSFRNIPLIPDPQKEGQLSLIKLREAVQSQGRLRDARLVLSFEVGFHPDEVAKQQACLSLIEACKHPGRVEPVWAVEGAVRSMLAQSYRRVGDFEAAEKETNLALNILKTAVSLAYTPSSLPLPCAVSSRHNRRFFPMAFLVYSPLSPVSVCR